MFLETGLLILGVCLGSAILGTCLAAATTFFTWPGSRFLDWALLLPFSIPPYVLTFLWLELFDIGGPLDFGFSFAWRGLPGGIVILSFSLYPYVYLLAKEAFHSQSTRALEASQSLGASPSKALWRTALPLAKPWIGAGLVLVAMEILSDFGAVSLLGVQTFTIGIYRTWYSLQAPETAAQLASFVVVVVFFLFSFEKRMREKQKFYASDSGVKSFRKISLSWRSQFLLSMFSWGVFALAFLIPVFRLIQFSLNAVDLAEYSLWKSIMDQATLHSISLGFLSAALITAASFVLILCSRTSDKPSFRWGIKLASVGYALPGAVLAVGVFLPLAWLDQKIRFLSSEIFGVDSGMLLTGTIAALVYGYAIRFSPLSLFSIGSAAERISPNLALAARTLGAKTGGMARSIYLPAVRKGLLVSVLFVMVDVMKEMPLTLMVRPFGWDTLAVKIYQYTSEGLWQTAALPSLKLVLVGLIPTLLLIKKVSRQSGTPWEGDTKL
jgi:iron(III) transport system permease protein